MFVKKGDKVRVIAGKDKGVEAVVLKALPKVNKVVVEGVAIVKKHQKPNNVNPQGAIVEKEAPIHASKVQVLDKNGVAGRVVSDKMDKTITVVVETKRNHPVYGKRINYSKKYKAHDENNVAKEGDIVRIMETRPLSATKRFRLVEVVEEAVII